MPCLWVSIQCLKESPFCFVVETLKYGVAYNYMTITHFHTRFPIRNITPTAAEAITLLLGFFHNYL